MRTKTALISVALLFVNIFDFAWAARGDGNLYSVEYPPSPSADGLQLGVTYTIWMPPGVQTVRGVIVHQHGAGIPAAKSGMSAAYDLHWQALARKWDCALLGPSYHVLTDKTDASPGGAQLWFDPRRGSEKAFLKALSDFALKSGHPEIESAPWILWGHSGGGIWSDVMSQLHPDRIAALWLRSGTAYMWRGRTNFAKLDTSAAVYAIPTMCNAGVQEMKGGPWIGSVGLFKDYRAHGAPIGFAPDPLTGHWCGNSRYLAIPFLDACMAMRLPDKGSKDQTLKPVDMGKAWLAPLLGSNAVPADQFQGDKNESCWLPNQTVARDWMEYVATGGVSDTTPPPAPFDVKVTSLADEGTQISWDAEADFESGIGKFIVLRDGQELGCVPPTNLVRFHTRPTFQAGWINSFNDSPADPAPEMCYIDAWPKDHQKHSYAVITVNTVGLQSAPSSPVSWQPERPRATGSAGSYVPFEGERATWHQEFARYDYVMDDKTLEIQPFKRDESEGFGIREPAPGQHRCVVVCPMTPAPGNPWSWRGVYWNHQPQTEVELLRRGFHVAYISANATLRPDVHWDAWYAYLTEKHGLSTKPAFVGMSRGGEYEFTWAVSHPDKVACIYADNPGGGQEMRTRIGVLATNDVPVLEVCGSIDPILHRDGIPIENIYHQFGGRISIMIKEGRGHHPHSLRDPKPIADFIEQSVNEVKYTAPSFVNPPLRQSYYSYADSYVYYPSEGTYVTCRGPLFTPRYDRYEMRLANVDAFSKVVCPQTPAPGKPWVFRADYLKPDAVVDQALLAKGFYIVTGAVAYAADGPDLKQWDIVYQHLMKAGFSPKPVMEGDGGAAGEAYAWAIANPDKVSCIYAENPWIHSYTAKTQPIDDLAPLAKAGIPILHVCGSLDPFLADNTRVVEQRYKQLGGNIKVIIQEGRGHYPLSPDDFAPVVDFITHSVHATQ